MDFNQVSTKRTEMWSATFQYQAQYYTMLEIEVDSGYILNTNVL